MTDLPELMEELIQAILDLETDSYYSTVNFEQVCEERELDHRLLITTPAGSWDVEFAFIKLEVPGAGGLPEYNIRWRFRSGRN